MNFVFLEIAEINMVPSVLIDVCSCSLDVWKGITSYVKAIVKKLNQEIGVEEGKAHIGIIQVSSLGLLL